MNSERRRLLVVRHAKSAWPPGVPDRSRPLAPRGQSDAPRMGERIGAAVGLPDVVVVSPAERARQTWDLISQAFGPIPDQRIDDRVYDDWGSELIDVVRDLPDSARTAILVGHEPGVSQLVLSLADRSQPSLRARIDAKFPTCAVALLTAPLPWEGFVPGCATLAEFLTPKD